VNEARYGIVWGAVGAARSCFEAALQYAGERQVFGKPVAGYQIQQQKLALMALAVYEGTADVHSLVVGGALTGIQAFR
jgi:glutaryl-CoA dehydrogenase